MNKQSKFRDLSSEHKLQTGPEYIAFALQELDKLRALSRPTDEYLKSKNLNRKSFEKTIDGLSNIEDPNYNLSDINKANKNKALLLASLKAPAIGMLTGSGVNLLSDNLTAGIASGVGAAGISALLDYINYKKHKKNLYNTSRVLKDYGLFNPDLLRKSKPLIKDPD